MKILVFVMIFLLVGAFFIISNNNIHVGSAAELNKFADAYYSWFGKMLSNAKTITGYTINMRWLP